jgi:hypothetical protein
MLRFLAESTTTPVKISLSGTFLQHCVSGITLVQGLEIISPGGFEEAFREMGALGDALTPEGMAEIAARYGVDADFDRTGPIMERHGLSM